MTKLHATPPGPEQIMEIAGAFQGSRLLLTAFELDIFTALGEEAVPSNEVATRVGTDPRGTDRLLNALCGMGMLEKEGGRFRNTEASARFLARGGEGFLSNLGHMRHLYDRWGTLTQAVRAGGTVIERGVEETFELDAFIEAMHRRALPAAEALVGKIDLKGTRRLLDVGGGSGAYAMAFCRAKADLTAVILDKPDVVPLTRKYVAQGGLARRIETVAGDYLTTAFGEDFDLVFFSAIVHINSPEQNQTLMNKAFGALRPGGQIAIEDFVLDDSRTRPLRAAIFALNMLVNTPGGDTYTEGEIRTWLARAGCERSVRHNTGPSTALIVGFKGS